MRAIDKLGNIGNREDIEALKSEVNSEMDALQARVKDQAETIIAQKAVYETLSEKLEKYKRVVDAVKTARWHPKSEVGIALRELDGEKITHLLPIGHNTPICGADPENTPFHFTFHWVNVTCGECLAKR